MTESNDNGVTSPINDRLDITRGVMSMLDSWGLHSDEMMALLDMPGKARHFAQYRYNKPLPDSPDIMKRVEYLIRIDDALRTSYPTNPSMGKRWLRQRSHKFNKHSPLSMMMGDGEQGMIYVLSRLDCTFAWDQSGSKPC
ncbi:MAG: MbcA/ParS/Xre antitoxin family protein [Candidatus Thiodiazotropha sp.]|nr:MbcA/ParS/Xre antitoxin family protein [Candidatus Thiodiazotropha sp.]MCM8883147.1 MbcA/ParS/Xre antitoxin family protein [Candidatus Thiodiazotropha sp.]MCM8918827.1 MbcA/ParS/Xre antitoxin family protein [Candidatus Thiodiazotropha sp.]MCU7870466.1 MbcA/ParS/Xre antitoxin family protein [Candidatus Thiodiazotropha sp. (ex Lucinoma borealis)]MCU7874234.1 MbcA/ParS/Xre antitoxin family protein [Candidatus Thiodiazotropha sp. (ex Lucinoma borealis)]